MFQSDWCLWLLGVSVFQPLPEFFCKFSLPLLSIWSSWNVLTLKALAMQYAVFTVMNARSVFPCCNFDWSQTLLDSCLQHWHVQHHRCICSVHLDLRESVGFQKQGQQGSNVQQGTKLHRFEKQPKRYKRTIKSAIYIWVILYSLLIWDYT